MGIPSYFSYILKKHSDLIKKLAFDVHNLYIDSNSVIYDALRSLKEDEHFEENLIHAVCSKLDEYIHQTKPSHTIFIAFDGVAPVAKLEQQRNRRYKSTLEKQMMIALGFSETQKWSSTAITPGTHFMEKLGIYITDYYKKKEASYGVKKIIVSTSDDIGEGEHKIFHYIRQNPTFHKKYTSLIYGLDADLIMLSLNHLPITRKIYLFREAPEFVKSINVNLEPDETYILDIPKLADVITLTMNNYRPPNTLQERNRLYDYIFLCFFLGNDFMPHFPSINIRTNGIQTMLEAYQKVIGDTNQNLTNGRIIYWGNVRKLVKQLADEEWKNIAGEYKIRARWEKRGFPTKTKEERMNRYLHIPIKNRTIEKLIDPFQAKWETRYYKYLFHQDVTEEFKKQVCMNYLEGLEWTMNYYTSHCKDWRWCYKYAYPPLLKDLVTYIPHWETDMIEANNSTAVSPFVQLAYVLPRQSLFLLPSEIYTRLMSEREEWYPSDCAIYWAFCKYFWESHVDLPPIELEELERLVSGKGEFAKEKIIKKVNEIV